MQFNRERRGIKGGKERERARERERTSKHEYQKAVFSTGKK